MYQHRSYAIALENPQKSYKLEGMYVDEAKNGMSFRNYKNFLLLGGGGHRTEKKVEIGRNFENLQGNIILIP